MAITSMDDDVVIKCFKGAANACRNFPFMREEELQWYFGFLLGKRTSMQICREVPTDCAYYTEKETGLLKKAEKPVHGELRRRGHFDIICSGSDEKWIIELKFPRGKDQAMYYEVGLKRDFQKLKDASGATRLYALCLIQSDYRGLYEGAVDMCRQKMLTDGIRHHIEVYDVREKGS